MGKRFTFGFSSDILDPSQTGRLLGRKIARASRGAWRHCRYHLLLGVRQGQAINRARAAQTTAPSTSAIRPIIFWLATAGIIMMAGFFYYGTILVHKASRIPVQEQRGMATAEYFRISNHILRRTTAIDVNKLIDARDYAGLTALDAGFVNAQSRLADLAIADVDQEAIDHVIKMQQLLGDYRLWLEEEIDYLRAIDAFDAGHTTSEGIKHLIEAALRGFSHGLAHDPFGELRDIIADNDELKAQVADLKAQRARTESTRQTLNKNSGRFGTAAFSLFIQLKARYGWPE